MRRIGLIAVMAACSVSFARQSAPQPPAQPPPGGEQRPEPKPEDKAAFRARIERWLAENKRTQERLEAAIKKLDSGASVADVQAETRPFGRFRGGESERGKQGPDKERDKAGPPRFPGDDMRRPPEGGGAGGERLPREVVIEQIEKHNPEMAKRMRELLKDNPSMGGRLVDRVEPMVREIMAERDPEMRQLRIDNMKNGFDLLGATRAFVEANRADANSQDTKDKGEALRAVLGAHFDLMVKMHQQEIVMLERRIKQLREEVDQQLTGRNQFIEKRIEDAKRFRGRGGPPGGPSGPDQPPPK